MKNPLTPSGTLAALLLAFVLFGLLSVFAYGRSQLDAARAAETDSEHYGEAVEIGTRLVLLELRVDELEAAEVVSVPERGVVH
jgi:uncharacterized protein (DUF58 family)